MSDLEEGPSISPDQLINRHIFVDRRRVTINTPDREGSGLSTTNPSNKAYIEINIGGNGGIIMTALPGREVLWRDPESDDPQESAWHGFPPLEKDLHTKKITAPGKKVVQIAFQRKDENKADTITVRPNWLGQPGAGDYLGMAIRPDFQIQDTERVQVVEAE